MSDPAVPTAPADPVATFAPDLFAGQVALVTGGGRGIGRRIALAFARLGADVVIGSRHDGNRERTRAEIEQLGRACLARPLDIRDVGSVEALRDAAVERFGGIDHLVNNAGGQFPAPPERITDRGWRAVVDLNLNGTWNMCHRFAPVLIRRGGGSIVNIVHPLSFGEGAPPFAHSGAARAGVVNLTQTLALYLAPHQVTANALAPGSVSTTGWREEELAQLGDDADAVAELTRADTPAQRIADPDETAAVVMFLCSPAARYVTGTAVVQDGGWLLGNHRAVVTPGMRWELDDEPDGGEPGG